MPDMLPTMCGRDDMTSGAHRAALPEQVWFMHCRPIVVGAMLPSLVGRQYLGGFIGHLDAILQDVDRELGAGVAGDPEAEV